MNPELKAQLDLEIQKAPAGIQEFLKGDYFKQTLARIVKLDNISLDQIETLELEITLEILGLNDYKNFDEAIQNEMNKDGNKVSQESISQLIKDINEFIFDKIRDLRSVPTENKVVKVMSGEEEREEKIKEELRKIISNQRFKPISEAKKIEYVPPTRLDYDIYREKVADNDKIIEKE